ncbi:MAG: metalloregulator ArsR/SmtB family transcription factor [Candidatus Bipolaricaulota bacterium]|nr:metalloregulator ArsR/SmtB family transcription factor [Candidatus Bipolaricaulota bacterium]MCX7844453.1 metalloregulator ArsR/SmtB family transcription factor [Candidatus Bipolaricaulota bacterium]MDW8152153.1 metalloregulator ArsR/SmtB family transcription factor [Candidatus Bipolaricaulota bacterium]
MAENLQRWAKVFAALGNAERLAVVSYLLARRRGHCTEIAEAVRLSTPALSYHLRFLEEAGLIVRERRGRRRCVRVSPELRRLLRPAVVEALRKEGAWNTR